MLDRKFNACLMRPEDVSPSDDALEVVGTFNPGALAVDGEVVLLVRVAERPRERRDAFTALPRREPGAGLAIDWVANEELTFIDPRVVEIKATGDIRLTFISHILVARSKNGRSIDSVSATRFFPQEDCETYGVEDPRITRIQGPGLGDEYHFTYVAVSKHGAGTALASTADFDRFERHGIVFPPENKDVLLFPERIGGEYAAFHRPNPATHFTPPEMWLAYSSDLIHWGRHEPFHGGAGAWESGRIGGGCPPMRTERGWLEIYHGNERSATGVGVYSAGAVLLDIENPQRVLGRTDGPIMVPEADFEREGFVADVVFPTGLVDRGDVLQVYYGAADANVGVVEWAKADLLAALH
ncbi:MAG: glycoside hydrolase family 130 protein [Candidatus Hydrogenedentes bacterium]|nr:glycoside hydrolase family 130 protein [Candidatus Hydrogenedentota bacterium]